jgi:hypothetical protein
MSAANGAPMHRPTNAILKIIINSGLPWTMEIVEWFPCSCIEELEDREAWYISNNECVNENLPGACRRAGGQTAYTKQCYQNNSYARKAYQKQRYQNNSDAILAQQKQYKQENADSIKACSKRYRQENAEAIKARKRHYNEENADSIKASRKQRYQHSVCKKVLHDMITRIEDEFAHARVHNTLDTSNSETK